MDIDERVPNTTYPCRFRPGRRCNGMSSGQIWGEPEVRWCEESVSFERTVKYDRKNHMENCMIPYLANVPEPYWKPQVVEAREEPKPVGIFTGKFESMYELTLTTTKDDPYELRQWFSKIVKSAMFDVVGYRACVELTEKGMPHIHAILYSGKKSLDASKVKALKYPYRYELARVRNHLAFSNYLIKMEKDVRVNMYCESKGIPQIWDGTKT